MGALPTGTVAFLMTDIEGSTRLAAAVGAGFPGLIDEHFALLDRVIADHDGTVVSSEGDSVFAAFGTGRQAVAAAVNAQRAIGRHEWPSGATVKVRVGIHVGEAALGGRDYAGLEVHRTARITAAAWGGQVLLSAAAAGLLSAIPGELTLRELGTYRLRDIEGAERLYQVVAPGIESEFPPLRIAAAATPTNLPGGLTRFIGRGRELDELRELVGSERLVTLTGPGGTGKTRLCVETARALLDRFPDGVWFVPLEAVRDPTLVIPTIAQVLGVREQPGGPIAAVLLDRLADETSLLVLDNLEQVVDAAPEIAMLLNATPSVSILVTSREPLSVAPERIYPVPPLGVPGDASRTSAADVRGSPSIELFVERARAVRPGFELTDENAAAVAAICRRLDGLPLAIELAAARLNVLSPNQILARLDDRLTLLAGSRRDLRGRQRTLRGAIDWSHDLLSDAERVVFRRLSVFSGGADLDAIHGVVDTDGKLSADLLDVVSLLVDRSLVRATHAPDEARFSMLETIREYASERLADAGEAEQLEARHAEYFTALAEGSADVRSGPRQVELLDRFEEEIGNLRAAIAWSLRSGDPRTGLRLTSALSEFWHLRNHVAEAVGALDDLLAASAEDGVTVLRERAVLHAAGLLTWLADDRSGPRAEEGLAMAEQLQDVMGLALAKSALGWSLFYTKPQRALAIFAEGFAAARAAGDATVQLQTLMGQTWVHQRLGHLDEVGELAREVIALGERTGVTYHTSLAMLTLGAIDAAGGDLEAARTQYVAALRRAHAAGAGAGTALGLDALATLALDRGDVPRAIRLAAAADRLREEIGGNVTLSGVGIEEPLMRAARVAAPAEYQRAADEGNAMTVDEAVEMALQDAPLADRG